MSYKIRNIDPTKYTFCFRLDKYDCYGLRKGICSLYLSNEEAKTISQQEEGQFKESSVLYCRNLAKELLDDGYFENESFQNDMYSIRLQEGDCGHYQFTDGQHRTCIAKHLQIHSMYVNFDDAPRDFSLICSACREKIQKEIEDKKVKNKILSIFKKKKEKEIPAHFIDKEYIEFRKDSPVKLGD